MRTGFRKLLAAPALFAIMVACHCGAEAATIYTYSFEQTGYTIDWGHSAVLPATLKGSFTGTPDAFHINLGTLSAFQVQFDTAGGSASYSGLPDYFSFEIGDTSGGTLAFQTPVPLFPGFPSEACVGVAVSALCNGGTARGYVRVGPDATALLFSRSDIAPVVTLVSAVSPTPEATTPVPGAILLFSTALAGLGAACARRRKPAAAFSA
jgi:hypothetical protein